MTEERSKTFGELYIRNYDRLVHIGYHLLDSREQAEELTQETFLLALVRIDDLANLPCPEGWLAVTLTNLIRNERRRCSFQEVPPDNEDELSCEEIADRLGISRTACRSRISRESLNKCVCGGLRIFCAINSLLKLDIHPVCLRFRASF